MKILLIGLVIIVVLFPLISNFLQIRKRNALIDELALLLAQGKYKEYEKSLETKEAQFLIPSFNLKYMKLSSALVQDDQAKTKVLFKELLNERMSDKQKFDVYLKGFNYFMTIKDTEMIEEFYALVMTLKDEKAKREVDCLYDTEIKKGYKYLDALLEDTSKLEEKYRGINEYLISLMYRNKNDTENADKYLELSQKHLKMLNSDQETSK